MNTPFSSNPKLADWKPSAHLIKIIKETKNFFEIYYGDLVDTDNIFFINLINVIASERRFEKGATTPELVEAVHTQVIQIGEASNNRKKRISNEK